MKCFVVLGEIGEYSDRMVWVAKVFHDEENAKHYVIEATLEAKRLYKEYQKEESWKTLIQTKGMNKVDFNQEVCYEEANYFYEGSEIS